MMMALLSRDQTGQENPAADVAWSVLDAANDLGDTLTDDACRRGVDADLPRLEPAPSSPPAAAPAQPAPVVHPTNPRTTAPVARPPPGHVGRLQARGRRGAPARGNRVAGPPRPDRLVRRDRPAGARRFRADGPRHRLP